MATSSQHDIEAANGEFMEAIKAGDEARFVRCYAEDALLLLPGNDPLAGRAGAQAFFASLKARGVRRIQLSTLEVETFGDTAWERGSYESRGADDALLGKGKYIVIWKRTADGWKMYRDILNPSS